MPDKSPERWGGHLKLTEPLLYMKLLLLLGLTKKENARIGYTCSYVIFCKLHAGEFKIAQTKAQRGRHLSYARLACVCVHIADTARNDYPILSDTKTNWEEKKGNGVAHVRNLRGKCKIRGREREKSANLGLSDPFSLLSPPFSTPATQP